MDAITLGTIVHDVMKDLYSNRRIITKAVIDSLRPQVGPLVKKYINEHYTHNENGDEETGETEIVGQAINYFVNSILTYDSNLGKFRFIMGEQEQKVHWNGMNIRQYIDRVDAIIDENGNEHIRIVDYKTGADPTSASSVAHFITDIGGKRCKAMLQLMLYCNVYAHDKGLDDTPIQPVIYKVQKMSDSGFKVDKKDITNYYDINKEFLDVLNAIKDELLSKDTKFKQTGSPSHCSYCKYAAFCHR